MTSAFVWLPSVLWTFGGAGIALGADPTGAVAYNSGAQQAVTIPNTLTAPSGVTSWYPGPHSAFTAGLPVHTLGPQQAIAIWVQQTAMSTPSITQSLRLDVTYQSSA
jgi:hypothetical protein